MEVFVRLKNAFKVHIREFLNNFVYMCLPWFLVNNRWFTNGYLQDQLVNLKTYCVRYFSTK